ncbi:HAMP domain-containing protein, partial [Microvirga sp. Mcv34]|uniref:HAMP domain-containing protein n=1 Tax=Microvirga sp. Mcv34 TaxID=2926016 RepID=UPI0021C5BCCD
MAFINIGPVVSASWGRAPPAGLWAGRRGTMRFLNNLKLIFKLAIPTAIFVAITIGLIAIAKNGLDTLSADTKKLVNVESARLITILNINAEVNEASIQEKNIILLSSTEQDRLKSAESVYQEYKKLALQHADELIAFSDSAERRTINENIKATLVQYFALMDKSVAHSMQDDDFSALQISNGEGRDLRMKVRNLLTERIAINQKALDDSSEASEALASSTSTSLIVSSAIGLSIAIALLGAIVVMAITRPLNHVTGSMGQLAEGDLSVTVSGTERKDEVGA